MINDEDSVGKIVRHAERERERERDRKRGREREYVCVRVCVQ